ncbi:hypothetical protein ACFLV1_01345 [Chloroflexota bacterium]
MRRLLIALILALMLMVVSIGSTIADEPSDTPFSVVVTGQLNAESTDFYDLDGAMIFIEYIAPSMSDTPSSIHLSINRIYSEFDVFTMNVEITERPNNAPDITDLTTTNKALVANWYPPGTDNDECTFDSRRVNVLGSIGPLEIGLIQIDFGSQDFFSGTDPVMDLYFFNEFFGMSVTPGPFDEVYAGRYRWVYNIENMIIMVNNLCTNQPPAINSVTADLGQLWPPNHKPVDVTIAVDATDPNGPEDIVRTTYSVADEYGEYDVAETDLPEDGVISLIAERDGKDKDGRVYMITITVYDAGDLSDSRSVNVIVLHDQGKKGK